MPPDKQLFAAQLRRRQLQKQLPLHDLHPKFCSSLTESELAKFHKFCNKRRLKAAGVGQVMEVKEATNFVREVFTYICVSLTTYLEPVNLAQYQKHLDNVSMELES